MNIFILFLLCWTWDGLTLMADTSEAADEVNRKRDSGKPGDCSQFAVRCSQVPENKGAFFSRNRKLNYPKT